MEKHTASLEYYRLCNAESNLEGSTPPRPMMALRLSGKRLRITFSDILLVTVTVIFKHTTGNASCNYHVSCDVSEMSAKQLNQEGLLSTKLGVIIQGPFLGENRPLLGHFDPLLSHLFLPP